ncbi:sugar ABC transporter substrate-binding protein [Streptomyces himalayensis]|uniref:sugar ABC transporter substrate-binding protein n=1 Tax=Streptomyces himalayensis TaxID=2820085 RepID=UPI0028AB6808|nr:substrate-binding domain-containing protein [Streptomyces himalayensis]
MSLIAGLGACGQAGESSGGHASGRGGPKIGLLLPEHQTARYETFDRPLVEKKIKELCSDCTVEYANAHGDVATQLQQVDTMILKQIDVLILGAVDTRYLGGAVHEAQDAGIPVISYDRLVEGPVAAYVSYGSREISKAQGEALLEGLGNKADGGQVVRVEGPEMTPWATFVLKDKVKIKTYQAAAWDAGQAQAIMSRAIADLGASNIDGVWAANDAIAAGVISALKAARIRPLPPVAGQDAELGAVQRIVSGEQYSTVYKPYQPEADAAATMAIALGRGQEIGTMAKDRVSSSTTKNIPAVLLTPISMTVHNIKSTVVKDGTYMIDQICTPKYRSACQEAGLIE